MKNLHLAPKRLRWQGRGQEAGTATILNQHELYTPREADTHRPQAAGDFGELGTSLIQFSKLTGGNPETLSNWTYLAITATGGTLQCKELRFQHSTRKRAAATVTEAGGEVKILHDSGTVSNANIIQGLQQISYNERPAIRYRLVNWRTTRTTERTEVFTDRRPTGALPERAIDVLPCLKPY